MVKIKKEQKGKLLYIAPLGEVTGMICGFILFFLGIGGLIAITIMWIRTFDIKYYGYLFLALLTLIPILSGLFFARITRLKLYEKGFIPSIRPIKFLFRPNDYFITYDIVTGIEGLRTPSSEQTDELHIKLGDGKSVTCWTKEADMVIVITTFKKYCPNVSIETKIVRE